jgi:hypothetical protein
MDGTGVPMVPWELQGRPGKQPDGSAKTREVKLGCVFTRTTLDEEGRPVRDPASTVYTGTIEDAATFGWRLYPLAVQQGLFLARRVVVLADAAEWIKNLVHTHFPMAQFIVDFYHAKQHVAAVYLPRNPLENNDARREVAFFHKNKDHMRYAQFQREGLFIGSGVIEAACKNLVGKRLKQSGMEWTERGANAIIALRCATLSHRFQDYWDARAA